MPRTAGRSATGSVLADRIARQAAVLAGLEPAVRADEPDAVHRMRVACRRLRGALRAYGPSDAAAVRLAGELRWLGSELGRARDCEVLGELLLTSARELPPECEPEALAERLTAWSRDQYVRAWPDVLAALDSERYRVLLGTLTGRSARPPAAEDLPAMATLVRRQQRLVAARLRKARRAEPGPRTDRALHEARKAAKWARYLGETAGPQAGKFTSRMKALQDLLGVHQDTVVAREALLSLARDAGRLEFAYGALYGGQLAVAARAREQLPDVWRRARKRPKFS